MTDSVARRWALVVALLLWIALAIFGARVHWVEASGTAERDGFVTMADQLLAGEVPADPYRPLLYPIAAAALATLVGDTFVAARLLSNLAAAALALLAYFLAEECVGSTASGPVRRSAAAWAMALTATNPNLWILGQHVTTDMSFAALAALLLWLVLRQRRQGDLLSASALGLSYGMAAFTRGNAVFFLPGVLAAFLAVPKAGIIDKLPRLGWRPSLPGVRWRPLVLAAATAVLVLVGHYALRAAAFGDPFHDENWKNIAWKLYGDGDWSYLDRVPFDSVWQILEASPAALLTGAVRELGRFAFSGLTQLLGTQLHVLAFGVAGAWFLRRRREPALLLLAASMVFVAALATVFFTWGRFLLFLLPVAAALTATASLEIGVGFRSGKRVAAGLLGGLVVLLAVKTVGFRLPAFVDQHPYGEIALLRQLENQLGEGEALAGTAPFAGRLLEAPYLGVRDSFGAEHREPGLWFEAIQPALEAASVRYLVVSDVELRDRPASLLGELPPVPWLEMAERQGGVVAWRVLTRPLREDPAEEDSAQNDRETSLPVPLE